MQIKKIPGEKPPDPHITSLPYRVRSGNLITGNLYYRFGNFLMVRIICYLNNKTVIYFLILIHNCYCFTGTYFVFSNYFCIT